MKEYPHWEVGLRTITDLVPLFILIFVSCFLVWFHEEMRSDTGIHSPRNCTPLWKESSTYLPIWLGSVTGCRGGHLYLGYRSKRSGFCVELRTFPTLFFLLMFYGFGKGVRGEGKGMNGYVRIQWIHGWMHGLMDTRQPGTQEAHRRRRRCSLGN